VEEANCPLSVEDERMSIFWRSLFFSSELMMVDSASSESESDSGSGCSSGDSGMISVLVASSTSEGTSISMASSELSTSEEKRG